MDRSLSSWLATHGKRNVFDAFSEAECQDLLKRLEDRLQQEELLTAEVHSLVEEGQRQLREPRRTTAPEMAAVPPLDEPTAETSVAAPDRSPTRNRWLSIMAMACGVFAMVGWSAALYQWGYARGTDRALVMVNSQAAPTWPTTWQLPAHAPEMAPKAMKPALAQADQQSLALAKTYRLVEPLQWQSPSLLRNALEASEALHSPFLGQNNPRQLTFQWSIHNESQGPQTPPSTRLTQISLGASRPVHALWTTHNQAHLTLPRQFPKTHDLLPSLSLSPTLQHPSQTQQ